MQTISSGLTTAYADKTLERLRTAVLNAVLPGGVEKDKAVRAYAWVLQGDLRCLFPGAPAINGIFADGPGTLDVAGTLEKTVPGHAALELALPKVKISSRVVDLIKTYLLSSLPQRRIEGYCALACVCALGRKDHE